MDVKTSAKHHTRIIFRLINASHMITSRSTSGLQHFSDRHCSPVEDLAVNRECNFSDLHHYLPLISSSLSSPHSGRLAWKPSEARHLHQLTLFKCSLYRLCLIPAQRNCRTHSFICQKQLSTHTLTIADIEVTGREVYLQRTVSSHLNDIWSTKLWVCLTKRQQARGVVISPMFAESQRKMSVCMCRCV